jgi:hypothetical protein
MGYVEDNDRVRLLFDLVTDPPFLPAARRVLASVFVVKGVADAVRIVQQRPGDELGCCRGDFLGKA